MESKRLLQNFVADNRRHWDKEGVRQAVRDDLNKVAKCRTPLLGAEIYASDSEIKTICHSCKSRFCTACGNRATLTWQREQWCALPDCRYSEITLTTPDVFWPFIEQDRQLLADIAALGASVVNRWVQAHYGVVPLILVIPHTFGRRLNFHPHLHILVSAGGLDKKENRWIEFKNFNKYVLMYWWRFAVVQYFAEVLGAAVEDVGAFDETLKQQGKRRWNIHIRRFSSKAHFLRYAGRYLRRPPIAERRIISVTDQHVEYWANDLRLKAWVRIKVSIEEFLTLLTKHVPDRYAHAVRYFGLASPAGKHQFSAGLFSILGQDQRSRPKRLSFEAMSVKYFDSNPLLDSHGYRMRWIGRQRPVSVSAAAA